MAEQTVELAPGESRVVSFQATPQEAKTYQVSVDGLTGSFVAVPRNLLANPGFESGSAHWTHWVDGVRGHWYFSIGYYETHTGRGVAVFSASMSGRYSEAFLSQVVPWSSNYRGKTFNLSVFTGAFPSSKAHHIKGVLTLIINDGVSRSEAEIYVDWPSWQQYSVTRALSIYATKLEAIFRFIPHSEYHGSGFSLDDADLRVI